MKEINCLGDMCPIPMLKLNQALESLKSGESVKLITDHSCVVQSVKNYFKKRRMNVQTDEVINGVWEMIITKN